MKTYEFLVKGGHGDYELRFTREGSKFSATCTCKAGLMDMYCKHRFAIMAGDKSAIISPNAKQASEIPALLEGTDVEAAMRHVKIATETLESAENELSKQKKLLAKLMQPTSGLDRNIKNITCTKCGLVTPLQIGWIKRNEQFVCDCGASMKLKVTYE